MIAWMLVLAAHAAEPLPYDEVKTAFVERFTRHVEWPGGVLPPDEPFVACVLGDDPIERHLERLAEERTMKDRPLEVRRLVASDAPHGCDLVWIARSARRLTDELVAATAGQPVLLVGDSPGMAEQGVHLELWLDDGQVRFDANLDAARASHLEVSSQLLRYARIVAPRDPP